MATTTRTAAGGNGARRAAGREVLTLGESAQRGKAARKVVPRPAQAEFAPAADRVDPVQVLERQAESRVPELVPIRYGRMLVSPFTFYRGAAAIMAQDLASTPHSGLQVQCCGDAHLSNFGVFASPDRRLVFDLNDFDETLPGPWEWDVKRLVVSIVIAAQSNGFGEADQRRAALDTVATYRTTMATFAGTSTLDVWYSRLDIDDAVAKYGAQFTPKAVKGTKKALAKARTKDSMSSFSKLTRVVDGEVRIVDESPLVVPIEQLAKGVAREELFAGIVALFDEYRDTLPPERRRLFDQFRLVDVARKVVGVGSVGTRAWIALMLGPRGDEPLFLQIKQAESSVLEDVTGASEFDNHGQRVVVGQHLMQASSDIFLGWLRQRSDVEGQQDYYCRQLKDWKGSAEIEQMDPGSLAAYGRMCGWTLARAHARSGDRVAIAAYLGKGDSFDQAVLTFSDAYAQQNQRDYEALANAAASGRITAETGL